MILFTANKKETHFGKTSIWTTKMQKKIKQAQVT